MNGTLKRMLKSGLFKARCLNRTRRPRRRRYTGKIALKHDIGQDVLICLQDGCITDRLIVRWRECGGFTEEVWVAGRTLEEAACTVCPNFKSRLIYMEAQRLKRELPPPQSQSTNQEQRL